MNGWTDMIDDDFDSNPEIDLKQQQKNQQQQHNNNSKTTTTTTTTTSSSTKSGSHRRTPSFTELMTSSGSLPFQLDIGSSGGTNTSSSSGNGGNNNNGPTSINRIFSSSNSLDVDISQSPPLYNHGVSTTSSYDSMGEQTAAKTIKSLTNENFDLKMRIFYMEQSIKLSSEQMDVFKQNIDLKVELGEKSKRLEERETMVVKLGKVVDNLKEKIEKQKQREEKLRTEMDELTNLIAINELDKNDPKKKKEQPPTQQPPPPPQQQQVVIQYTKDPEDKDKLNQQQVIIEDLNEKIIKYDGQINELKNQIATGNNDLKNSKKLNEKYQQQIEDLKNDGAQQEAELQGKNKELQDKINELRGRLKEFADHDQDIVSKLEKELHSTKQKLETLKGHYEKLKQHYDQLKEHYDSENERLDQLDAMLNDKDNEIHSLLEQHEFNIIQLSKDHQDNLSLKVEEITQLRATIKRIREEFYASSLEKENNQVLHDNYKKEIELYQQDLNILQGEKQTLEQHLYELTKANQDNVKQFSHLESIHFKLIEDVALKMQEFQLAGDQYKLDKEEYKSLASELLVQKNQYQQLKVDYKQLEHSKQQYENQFNNLVNSEKLTSQKLLDQEQQYKNQLEKYEQSFTEKLKQSSYRINLGFSKRLIEILKSIDTLDQHEKYNSFLANNSDDQTCQLNDGVIQSLHEVITLKIQEIQQISLNDQQSIQQFEQQLTDRYNEINQLVHSKLEKSIQYLESECNKLKLKQIELISVNSNATIDQQQLMDNKSREYQSQIVHLEQNFNSISVQNQQLQRQWDQKQAQFQKQLQELEQSKQQLYQDCKLQFSNELKKQLDQKQLQFQNEFTNELKSRMDQLNQQKQMEQQQFQRQLYQEKQKYNSLLNSTTAAAAAANSSIIGNKRSLADLQTVSISDLTDSDSTRENKLNRKDNSSSNRDVVMISGKTTTTANVEYKDKDWVKNTIGEMLELEKVGNNLQENIKKVDLEIKNKKAALPLSRLGSNDKSMTAQKQPRVSFTRSMDSENIREQIDQLNQLLKSTNNGNGDSSISVYNNQVSISPDFLSKVLETIHKYRDHNRLLSYEFDDRSGKFNSLIDSLNQKSKEKKLKSSLNINSKSSSSSQLTTTTSSSSTKQQSQLQSSSSSSNLITKPNKQNGVSTPIINNQSQQRNISPPLTSQSTSSLTSSRNKPIENKLNQSQLKQQSQIRPKENIINSNDRLSVEPLHKDFHIKAASHVKQENNEKIDYLNQELHLLLNKFGKPNN